MTGKEIRKALEKDGWVCVRIMNGGTHFYKKEGVSKIVVVPMHNHVSIGVVRNIEKITGLSLREKK